MICSIALATTWRGDRSSRVRSFVLATAVAAVTVLACAAVSTALMVARVNERAEHRTFQPAASAQPSDMMRSTIYDSINGQTIFVYLWRIETKGVTVPGVPADADTGDWFVSPELAKLIPAEPLLQGRFPSARTIGKDGVGSADELVAYRFVGPEVALDERLVFVPGTDWIGLNAGIGGTTVALAGAGLVIVVGIGLLRSASGPIGVGLARRLTLLSVLGATNVSKWVLTAASAAIVSAPAAIISALAWYLIAPSLEIVPLVDQKVFRGDLKIPLWITALVVVGVVALSGLVALTRSIPNVGSRPTSSVPTPPSLWRVTPLLASLLVILYATTRSDSGAVRLLLTGLLAACLSTTFALPVILHRFGTALAGNGSLLSLLVGRRLTSNAITSTRPLLALAAAAVIIPVAASYVATARAGDPEPQPSPVSTFTVDGQLDDNTITQLEKDTEGTFVDVYISNPQPDTPTTRTWVTDCESLLPYMRLIRCDQQAIIVEEAALVAFFGLEASSTQTPSNASILYRLFVTNNAERAETVLRSYAVNSDSSRISVSSRFDRTQESRLVPWLITSIQIVGIGAFIALLLSVITHTSQFAATRLRLIGIGAELATIRRLVVLESFTATTLVGLCGAGVGTVGAVAYALVDGTVSPNYWPSLAIIAATLTTATLTAATSAIYVSIVPAQSWLNTHD